MMHACALAMDLRIPAARSLKAKRSVVKHIVETARSRYGVAAAEVGHQDQWQRAELGFAAVGGSPAVLDSVERFVWAQAEIDVVGGTRSWLEAEG
jgi:uncharacterized protein YlxP (DUF503 family)